MLSSMFPIIIRQSNEFFFIEEVTDLPIDKPFTVIQTNATREMFEYGNKVKDITSIFWQNYFNCED